MAWFENICQKFEDMFEEVDDMMKEERLRYIEEQLQTVGSNVKEFCSDFMREVLSSPSEETIDGAVIETPPVQSIGGEFSERERCDEVDLLGSSSGQPIKSEQSDVRLEQIVENIMNMKPDMFDTVTLADENACSSEGTKHSSIVDTEAASRVAIENSEICGTMSVTQSSEDGLDLSNEFAKSTDESVPEIEELSVEETGHDDDFTKLDVKAIQLPDNAHLYKSCSIVDAAEVCLSSQVAERRKSYKKRLLAAFARKLRTSKEENEKCASSYGNLKAESNKQKGKSLISSPLITNDHELDESDWVFI